MLRLCTRLLLLILIPWSISGDMRIYKHIGCFKDDRRERALAVYLGKVSYSTSCAVKAHENGYKIFSVQAGHECYSGPEADKTYDKYGKSNACWGSGLGGNWANDVYQFSDELLWPKGAFSLLKPSSGCPKDFEYNGWLLQDTVDNARNDRSAVLSIDGFVGEKYVMRSFCTKTQWNSRTWPRGKYCIYKEGAADYSKDGRIQMDNSVSANKDVIKMKYFKGIRKYKNSLYMYFYCQTNGFKSIPIDLPISHPFYLLPYGSSNCQQVKWMVATKEWVRYATRNNNGYQNTWLRSPAPYVEAGTQTNPGLTMFYCLYTSCNKTLNQTQGIFSSPGFPDNYPNGQLCSWRITVPENHTLTVRFSEFYIDNLNINDTDVLEFYRMINESFILNATYTGHREQFQVTSTSDMLFVFRTNEVNSSHGFHAEYRMFVPEITAQPTTTRQSTTARATTGWETTTHEPTTVLQEANKTKHQGLKDNSKGTSTGTVILVVIPLICFVLIVVVSIDIYCRFRDKFVEKYMHKRSPRTDSKDMVTENPTYDSSAGLQMNHLNSTTTVNTVVDADSNPQNTEEGYERLSRLSPRREVHEDYQELNRTSCPSAIRDSNLQDEDPGAFYHVVEGPTDEKDPCGDEMYQAVDRELGSNGLYARNTLYDRVV